MANTVTIKVGANTQDAESGFDRIANKSKSIGKGMTAGLTAPIAAIGVGALMTGAKFEKGMNRVKALSGATGGEFDALTQQAKDLGSSTMFSATEASDAMGFLAMAGFKTNDVLGAMPGVLNLAAAAQMDLGQAADITSNIMTGFNLEVKDLDRVNDVLVKGMTSANVDLQMLGESMKYVGPVAASAGMDFEETAAAVALLGNAGIQGSMAGTALRGAMTKLLKPSDDAALLMENLGINALDSEGNLKSFTEIIKELEDANIKTGDAMTIFGQRAGPAMMALVSQGSGALADMTSELEDSGGVAQSIADIQMEGMSGAITEMKSAFEGLMIAISEDVLPIFTKLIDAIIPILQKFTNMPGPVKLIVVVVAGLLAVLGPLLILFGMMLPAIAALGPVFAFMGSGMVISTIATWAQALAMGALSLAMSPVTLAILGIAAAIAVGILVWKNWDKIVAVFKETFSKVKDVFDTVSQKVHDVLMSKWGWLLPGGLLLRAFKTVRDNWDAIWAAIRIVTIVLWEKISQTFTEKFGWLLPGGALDKAFTVVKTVFGETWETIKDDFERISGVVSDVFMDKFSWLLPEGLIFTAIESLKEKWASLWENMKDVIRGPINFIIGGVNSLIEMFNGIKLGYEGKKIRGVQVIPSFEIQPFNIPKIPLMGAGGSMSLAQQLANEQLDDPRFDKLMERSALEGLISDIRGMASGGIVNRPTLAMIGESGPEAVVPLNKMGSGGITVNFLGPTYGFDDFEEKVDEAITESVRRGGFGGILATA